MLSRRGVSVAQACRLLKVSRSGYDAWLDCKPSIREGRNLAVRRRKPHKGLIFHSDGGVQYAAKAYMGQR